MERVNSLPRSQLPATISEVFAYALTSLHQKQRTHKYMMLPRHSS
jgi:hypothetical protein